jgi:hypothetical protein
MLENLVDEKPVRSCRIRTIRDELDKNDAVLFMQYINDTDGWPSHTLARALTSRGVIIDPKAITRHRLNHCTCRFLNAKQS